MKVFITGNATCANRGDGAILRGLITKMESIYPNFELIVNSRFPKGSSYLLGRELKNDVLYEISRKRNNGLKLFFHKIFSRIRFDFLFLYVKYPLFRLIFPLPKVYHEPLKFLKEIDCMVHVGGSFFIDLYGAVQYEWLLLSRLANKPSYLIGHSLGPFEFGKATKMASYLFPKVEKVYLREPKSLDHVKSLNIDLKNIYLGTDTAWGIPEFEKSAIADAEMAGIAKPIIAITVRNLTPFDTRLGISQAEYESRYIQLIDSLIEKGYHILCISMCTGLDGYVKDDRMIGYRIKKSISVPSEMTVLMHEYNDLHLGYILSKCKLLIGTRLHSVIISLRYGTPAIAVYYEHKSEGILSQLNLLEWSYHIKDTGGKSMVETIEKILANEASNREKVRRAIEKEQLDCHKMIQEVFSK